jgi:lysophospholipase L1-like esterase
MKKELVGLYIVVLLMVFTSLTTYAITKGKVEEKTKMINQKENIVLVGDSIFDWFPTERIFSDLPVVNSGVAGNTTKDILNDMGNRIYKYNPTKVFINIGTNDIEYDDSSELNEQVAQNIISIAEQIKQNRSKCQVYIVSILPVNNHLSGANDRHNSEIKEINQKLNAYAATNDVEYIDAFNSLIDKEGMFDEAYTSDGLHPNNLGYAKLTEILMKYIYE